MTKTQTLLGALSVALPALEAAKKSNLNPHFKSKYADFSSVLEAIRPITDHGLWFRQVSHDVQGGACIETYYIGHGDELSAGKVFVPADKGNAQGYGSAQTYARRYGLVTAFGLATEDDDGNAAAQHPPRAGGQSQEGAVSPPPSDRDIRPKDGGPTKTALDRIEKEVFRELESCGDDAMLNAYMKTREFKEAFATLEEYRPSSLYGPAPKDMPEFVPIEEKVKAMRKAFHIAALATA